MPFMTPPPAPRAAVELLDLWFGPLDGDGMPSAAHRARWFAPDSGFDKELADRFGVHVESAARAELSSWLRSARGQLAMLLLLDQLPRNLFRGSPRAFATDDSALALAAQTIDSGGDRLLEPIERVFVYLPFEHSEEASDQQRSVELFEALLSTASESARDAFQGFLDYAIAHRDCIERFGRFPNRNHALGRASTDAERQFLSEGGGFE